MTTHNNTAQASTFSTTCSLVHNARPATSQPHLCKGLALCCSRLRIHQQRLQLLHLLLKGSQLPTLPLQLRLLLLPLLLSSLMRLLHAGLSSSQLLLPPRLALLQLLLRCLLLLLCIGLSSC
jgi:hypothetical protein